MSKEFRSGGPRAPALRPRHRPRRRSGAGPSAGSGGGWGGLPSSAGAAAAWLDFLQGRAPVQGGSPTRPPPPRRRAPKGREGGWGPVEAARSLEAHQ